MACLENFFWHGIQVGQVFYVPVVFSHLPAVELIGVTKRWREVHQQLLHQLFAMSGLTFKQTNSDIKENHKMMNTVQNKAVNVRSPMTASRACESSRQLMGTPIVQSSGF